MIDIIGKTALRVGDITSWDVTWRNALDGEAVESCTATLAAGSTGLEASPSERPDPTFTGMVCQVWVKATAEGAGSVDIGIATNKGLVISRPIKYTVSA